MQNFTVIPSSDNIDESLDLLLANDETAISCSSGSAFPTENLYVGMFCYRTDSPTAAGGDYKLVGTDPTPTWVLVRDYGLTVIHAEEVATTYATKDVFVGSGSSHAVGLVPDAGSTSGTKRFLNESGAWIEVDAGREATKFKAAPSNPASMTVQVAAGFFSTVLPDGTLIDTEYASQSVTLATAPTGSNSRIDLIIIDPTTGVVDKVTGTAAGTPSTPSVPAGKLLIARVGVGTSVTQINAADITDVRSVWDRNVAGTRWCIGTGTGDAIVLAFKPAFASLPDGLELAFRMPNTTNLTTAPVATINSNTAMNITKNGGQALSQGDLPASGEVRVRVNVTTGTLELVSGGGGGGFSTSDVKPTFKTTADLGWVMMNDGTIGDASSAASTRANADCQTLFILLWTNVLDTWAPVVGGRGASAAADWAAHKKLTLPKALGRALAFAGAGSGLTSRPLGSTAGAETHTLTAAEQASMSVSGSASVSVSGSGSINIFNSNPSDANNEIGFSGNDAGGVGGSQTVTVTGSGSGSISGTATGGGGAHSIMSPEMFMNVMIKL
jgi:hypothetical protein